MNQLSLKCIQIYIKSQYYRNNIINNYRYLFEAYFYPGKRINYDGTPYKQLNEGPDEPWFYEERETHSDTNFGDKYL